MARLHKKYRDEIIPKLMKAHDYKNVHQVPKIEKISVNMGLGAAVQNPKIVDGALEQLQAITGQKAVKTAARKSIATFKLRQGMTIGAKVTLRRDHMYEFLDRLVNIAIPRVRDFRGISPKSFDGRGNFSLGVKEQIIFPEINYDTVDRLQGLNITIVTSANTDDEARSLLSEFGMPFRK